MGPEPVRLLAEDVEQRRATVHRIGAPHASNTSSPMGRMQTYNDRRGDVRCRPPGEPRRAAARKTADRAQRDVHRVVQRPADPAPVGSVRRARVPQRDGEHGIVVENDDSATSAPRAASAGEVATRAPSFVELLGLADVRFPTATGWPAQRMLHAIMRPMFSRPTNRGSWFAPFRRVASGMLSSYAVANSGSSSSAGAAIELSRGLARELHTLELRCSRARLAPRRSRHVSRGPLVRIGEATISMRCRSANRQHPPHLVGSMRSTRAASTRLRGRSARARVACDMRTLFVRHASLPRPRRVGEALIPIDSTHPFSARWMGTARRGDDRQLRVCAERPNNRPHVSLLACLEQRARALDLGLLQVRRGPEASRGSGRGRRVARAVSSMDPDRRKAASPASDGSAESSSERQGGAQPSSALPWASSSSASSSSRPHAILPALI